MKSDLKGSSSTIRKREDEIRNGTRPLPSGERLQERRNRRTAIWE